MRLKSLLLFLDLFWLVKGNNSSGPVKNPFGGPLSTEGTLWCYECRDIFKSSTLSSEHNCRDNVSMVTLRQCGPEHDYCRTERLDLWGWSTLSIERSCSTGCPFGCRFNGHGLTYMKCISCCRKNGCNIDNSATSWKRLAPSWIIINAITLVLKFCCFIHQ